MQSPRVKIISDFIDFYDYLSVNENPTGTYIRNKSDIPSKGRGLAELRRVGVKTIEAKAARDIVSASNKLVVYTDPSKHDGSGRILMSYDEANMIYPNSLASEFFDEADGFTNKLLQIGSRRFKIVFKAEPLSLKTGDIVSIDEITPSYNMLLGLPIYSIDYIPTHDGMLAITLNTVERLLGYGLEKIITAEQVISEVYNALLKYNRI